MNANAAVKWARLAYEDPENIPSGTRTIRAWEVGNTRGLVGMRGEHMYVSVAGTERWQHWLSNMNVRLVRLLSGGRVHRGFWQRAFQCVKEVQNAQRSVAVMHGAVPLSVTYTGHSAGGAIACILAFLIESEDSQLRMAPFGRDQTGETQVNCVTFGSPKWCDGRLISRFTKDFRYVRCVNRWDVVTNAPAGLIPQTFPYAYGGELRWYTWGSITDQVSMLNHIASKLVGSVAWMARFQLAHSISQYIEIDWENVP